jgi:hypothetical protein
VVAFPLVELNAQLSTFQMQPGHSGQPRRYGGQGESTAVFINIFIFSTSQEGSEATRRAAPKNFENNPVTFIQTL